MVRISKPQEDTLHTYEVFDNMQTLITVVHVITCVLLVLVVLIQAGKGAEISTTFGGSSQTVFGSSGGANFFTRFTAGAAALFMVTSLVLTVMGGQSKKSLFEGSATGPVNNTPAATTTTPGASAPGGTKTAPSTDPATLPKKEVPAAAAPNAPASKKGEPLSH